MPETVALKMLVQLGWAGVLFFLILNLILILMNRAAIKDIRTNDLKHLDDKIDKIGRDVDFIRGKLNVVKK